MLCAASENGVLVGFARECGEDEGEDCEEYQGPLGPAPAFAYCYKCSDHRSVDVRYIAQYPKEL